jgi:hypothetical protein
VAIDNFLFIATTDVVAKDSFDRRATTYVVAIDLTIIVQNNIGLCFFLNKCIVKPAVLGVIGPQTLKMPKMESDILSSLKRK